jgi:hypothetical protein
MRQEVESLNFTDEKKQKLGEATRPPSKSLI